MSKSKWLEEVAIALRRKGLSSAYIRRFMDELGDHCDDLYEERANMDVNSISARLGMPEELANRAHGELRQRTFVGRHPLVTFVVAPLPVAILAIVGVGIAFMLAMLAVDLIPVDALPDNASPDNHLSAGAAIFLQTLVWSMRYLPFVGGAIVFCLLARTTVCASRWSFVACALVALVAGLFAVQLTLPTEGPESGSLMMGLGVPPRWMQVPQALAPLAIWAAFALREVSKQRLIEPARN
jgi:hypothetical protein